MNHQKSFTQKIEVAGDQLVDKVKELYSDAGAKRVIVRHPDGHELFSLPLTVGTGAGVLAALAAPGLAALAAIGGAIARVTLEVERTDEPSGPLV